MVNAITSVCCTFHIGVIHCHQSDMWVMASLTMAYKNNLLCKIVFLKGMYALRLVFDKN